MAHNYNKFNIKAGDIVILDKDYANSGEVKVISICKPSGLFAMVCNVNDESNSWEVMTGRLTPKTEDNENN